MRCRKRSVVEFVQESIVFLVRVQCRHKKSSRSLSHLLMSFLFTLSWHLVDCPGQLNLAIDMSTGDVNLCAVGSGTQSFILPNT